MSAVSPGLGDGDDQGPGIGHAVAVAVLTGDFDANGELGNALQPVTGGEAGMVAGAAGQNEDAVDGFEGIFSLRTEPTGLDGLGAAQHVEGVDDGARLLEDFLLHVVGIGPSSTASAESWDSVSSRETGVPS